MSVTDTTADLPTAVSPTAELDRLADEIRDHHRAVERAAQRMLDEAIAAGEKLLEAKGRLGHGEYTPFIRYCGVSPRIARVYMRLARNSGSAAVLEADSIRAALDALATPKKRPERLDFGPTGPGCPPHRQLALWREAMIAQGRPADEIRDRVDALHKASARSSLKAEELRYQCPTCGSKPGERCVTLNKQKNVRNPHSDRTKLVTEAEVPLHEGDDE